MSTEYILVEQPDGDVEIISEGIQGPTGPAGPTGPQGAISDTHPVTASEALEDGDLVNVWDDAGSFRVRRARADLPNHHAHGYVMAAVASGAVATVFFEGTNTHMTGLTPGRRFVSATQPGKTQATPPTGSGHTVQQVGFAVSVTAMNFDSGMPFALA
jgi:hypothetical protein